MQVGQPVADIAPRTIAILDEFKHLEGPLLPILHAVQAEFGYVPKEAVRVIADALNVTRAEVHGVVTFYHDFSDHPRGRHTLKVCRAEACQSMGGRASEQAIRERLGIDWHETTADGAVTLEPVYCLGLCACAPAAMVDGNVYGRIGDAGTMDEMLSEARR